MTKSLWKKIRCKTCGFEYSSHPDVLDEKKLDGDCIRCFRKKEIIINETKKQS